MKPSEKRALEAERRRLAEEKAEENLVHADSLAENDMRELHASGADKQYRRKESFFKNHIRLITFIITSALVLIFLSPIGIDMLVSMKKDKVITNKVDMDIDAIYAIYDNQAAVKWSNFDKYNYTDYSYNTKKGEYRIREYPISDSRLMLKVGGPSKSSNPDYIQLIDYKTGKFTDVFKSNPRDLVRSIEQEE